MDEHALIRLACDGDAGAFRAIFDGHRQRVFGLAYRYLRNQADAEDILQETFVKAYRGLPGFDPALGVGFASWLNRICVNASIDALRRARIRDLAPLEVEEAARMTAHSPEDDPERTARNREVRRQVDEALGRLSPKQKMIFTLRHDMGYTTREIAEQMDTTEGSVKKHLFRAIDSLKRHLRRFAWEDGYEL